MMDETHTNPWIFSPSDMENLPSFADGITPEQEFRYRVETTQFIQNLAKNMKTEHQTLVTAVVFFHRFYMLQSFRKYDRFLMGIVCLFLAGKSEENHMKLVDVMREGRALANKNFKMNFVIPMPNTAQHQEIVTEMMTFERILLQTLRFELIIPNPFKQLREDIKILKCDQNFLQMAWNFANDSLKTTVCLLHEPSEISAASLMLASIYTGYDLGSNWLETKLHLMGKAQKVESICRAICRLYVGTRNEKILQKFAHFMPKTSN